ncbi:MAG: energy transducer TonB [Nannocystaceae bacterium]|nr:energy transducer TonB [Nannocystaceae bacterium]
MGRSLTLALALALAPRIAAALPPETPAGLPAGLVPPELVEGVEVTYPAELAASDDPPQGEVGVTFVIGIDGVPHSIAVEQPLHPTLDALAVDAIGRLRYRAATLDGAPVEIVLHQRIAFTPPPPTTPDDASANPDAHDDETPPAEPTQPLPASGADAPLVGVVHEAGTRVPLPAATVLVIPAPDDAEPGVVRKQTYGELPMPPWQLEVRSDDRGRFAIPPLPRPARKLRVVATAPGFERFESIVAVAPGEQVALDAYLVRASDNPYRTVVRSEGESRQEVVRRSITAQEIGNLPGTQGDALKAITNFPGIARAPFGIGLLVIRGGDPSDSAVFLGEHEIPQLFHFGGLTSVFNADIITNIDFLPGNFDARYGDATGGIIDVKTRAGRRDGVHGYVDADLFDAGAMVEGPIGKGSYIVSARRSYIDAILPAVLPDDAGIGLTVAPRYYDYQAIFEYPVGTGKLTARVFGSDDRTKLVTADPNDVSADARNRFETTLLFHRVDLAYENHTGGWDILLTPSYRYDLAKAGAGDVFRFSLGLHTFSGRAEIGRRLGPRARLQLGTQGTAGQFEIDAESVAIPQNGTGDQATRLALDSKNRYAQPGLYGTLYLDAASWLTLVPSVRLTYYGLQFRRAAVDPRFRFVLRAGDRVSIRGGVGIYSQIPDVQEWNPTFGNPRLGPERMLHSSAAVRVELPQKWSVEIGGFHKHGWDLAAPSGELVRRRDGAIGPENFSSTGLARVYGGELFVRKDLTRRLFGWASYTLSRSERKFDPKEGFFRFDFDQTHILTLIAVYRLPRRWQVGARFRVVSGNPYTPHVGAVYDASTGDYIAIDGRRNAARVPTFHQLDLRVDKHFVWRKLELDAYADVQNVYNHQNTEFRNDAYDYSQAVPVVSLPILPSVGLRLSW